MAETEREIEVRTLSGECTRVSLAGNRSINDLKSLLALNFPPASSTPNFHLFFKGVKLRLQSQINALAMERGDFLVLVPFIKKHRQPQTPNHDFSTNVPKQTPLSSFADEAYSDMMQEFSSLEKLIGSQKPPDYQLNDDAYSGYKRKRDFDHFYDSHVDKGGLYGFLWSVLQSPNQNIIEEQFCEKFIGILESMNCLTHSRSKMCAFSASSGSCEAGARTDEKGSCLCPPWLKRIMEAFSFLNIFSAYLQMRKEEVTMSCLRDALKQLCKFGFKVGFEDIELLSVLCPKVVFFANNETAAANSADALVILDFETEERDQIDKKLQNGQKVVPLSKIFSAMRKRESAFKTNLWDAAKLLMCKRQNASVALFSLEDFLEYMKGEDGVRGSKDEVKWAQKNWSSASSSYSSRTKCLDTSQLVPVKMINHLRDGIGSKGQIVHIEDIGARKAIYVDIPHMLSDRVKYALACMGITKLYSHQAESILASLAGKNVVVATMTSSGKSLCYNVPVLEVLTQNLSACALYLFPTKALAQDQLRALLAMSNGLQTPIKIGVYDGDTSQKDRQLLRDNARLLITNPDMLHMSILPYHRQFSRILSNLRFVVIDEAHTYRGAFGCHTALILRRLRRLCSHVYGSDPSFVFSTATSANPREHCMELANLSTLELINNDGSPSSQKFFVLWNPASCLNTMFDESESRTDASDVSRKSISPISEVSFLFAEMVQHGLRCIAFCRSRKLTELVLCYTREILRETAPHLVDSVCAYRAGYVAEDRRKIERDFFCGKLCGIAATNALELGIDVGHIDATLHLGFPGSIASLWQQAGRSGRREKPSLALYVAFEGPLDQYFMKFPTKLFSSPIECCHINAENQQVVEQHLICAAFEHPLSLVYDEKYFGAALNNAVMSLRHKGELRCDPLHDSTARIWSYIGQEKMPSRGISIRAIETVRYRVIDTQRSELLEEIEESKAFFQVYEGAVYLHQGKTYLVKELDLAEKIAFCHEVRLQYYTKTRDYTDIHVLGGNIAYPLRVYKNPLARTTAQASSCRVTTSWFGFYCIQKGSNKILDAFDLSLPEYSYESQAVWIQVPQSIKKSVDDQNFSFRGGLHAASHAVLNVVPLFIRCDLSDLAPECPNPHDARYFPERILVYDKHPGGTGVSMQIQPYFTELLTSALELLTSCRCSGDTGCPNCVQSLVCDEYNEVIHKDAAIMIIKGVLDAEKSYFEEISEPVRNS